MGNHNIEARFATKDMELGNKACAKNVMLGHILMLVPTLLAKLAQPILTASTTLQVVTIIPSVVQQEHFLVELQLVKLVELGSTTINWDSPLVKLVVYILDITTKRAR
tara:strand:- start:426 stop:749 length:324 start_codon:yes stop_codon:yes gene_type:complete